MANLNHKKALVLGGSRGIGAAVVTRLRQEGADTRFTYANSDQAAEELAAKTVSKAIKVDSSNRDALVSVIRDQEAQHTIDGGFGA